MSNITNKDYAKVSAEAKARLDHIAATWFIEDPMLLGAWCLVDKQEDTRQNTLGIDSRINPPVIRYNPYFVCSLSKEKLELIMVSEGFKILLKHPTTRLRQPKQISNLASTITINQVLNEFDQTISQDKDFLTPDDFSLDSGKFFEEYFRKLLENIENTMSKLSSIFGEQKDGQDQQGQGQGQGQDQQGKDQQGQGNSNNFKEFKDEKDAMKDYMNPMGTSNQDWGKNDLFDADVSGMVKEKNSSKYWGKFTGNHQGEIVAANKPRVSWKEVLRRFNASVVSSKEQPSRMKVNRRYDLANPGHRRTYKSKVIFAIDASGSMSDEDLMEGFAVINSVCRHSELTFLLFDTEIKLIEKKIRKAKKSFKVAGRGGTDFNDVCKYAQDHKSDGLVIFTDGCASPPSRPLGVKVCWLMSNKEYKPPVDWGFVTHLDRLENVH